ncbi:MAG: hypothetical protein ABI776_04635 [Nocardioidaceae bacterium]
MNIDLTVFTLASLGIFAITIGGGLLSLHLRNRVPGLGFRDSLRAAVYLTQYEAALEYHGLRRREQRARVNELRANLADSAADGGAAAAIDRLGPPRVLAAEVAGAQMVPSWARGTLWLAAAVAVGVLVLVISTSAFLSAVGSATAPGATATWSPFFVTMTGTPVHSGPPTFTLELPIVTLALLLVPFGLGSRVWRLWTGKRARQVSVHGH